EELAGELGPVVVEEVLHRPRHGAVVIRRAQHEGVGPADRLADLAGGVAQLLDVGPVQRQLGGVQLQEPGAGAVAPGQLQAEADGAGAVRALPQAAADPQHVQRHGYTSPPDRPGKDRYTRRPPLASMNWPVTQRASSPARKATTSAMSSGVPS